MTDGEFASHALQQALAAFALEDPVVSMMAVILLMTVHVFLAIKIRHYVRKRALVGIERSAWRKLLQVGDDDAFMNTVGFTREVFFNVLLPPFRRRYRRYVRGTRRPAAFQPHDALGAILMFLHSTAQQKTLILIFGETAAVMSKAIRLGLICLVRALYYDIPEAAVKFPDRAQIEQMVELFAARREELKGVFGFIDGVKLSMLNSLDYDKQTCYYNGWLLDEFVSNVLFWLPDGTIAWAYVNAPGNWHDSVQASEFYQALSDLPPAFKVLCDSAFQAASGTTVGGRLLKASGVQDLLAITNLDAAITFCRQAAEWGNHILQGAFSRLRMPLPASDDLYRFRLISCCIMLLNVRTRLLGHSEIRTTHFRAFLRKHPIGEPLPENTCPVASFFGLADL